MEPSRENAERVARALQEFGVPLIEITEDDLSRERTQFMIGRPPCAIDFLTSIPGLDFAAAWQNRVVSDDEGFVILYLGRADLIKAKRYAGRMQDLADVEELERIRESEGDG